MTNQHYWEAFDALIQKNGITIDRPKGTAHPRFPDLIYRVDYGFIPGTSASDGQGIDVFRGSGTEARTVGILCTLDSIKKDAEVKVLYQCTEEDIQAILAMLTDPPLHRMLVRRDEWEATAKRLS